MISPRAAVQLMQGMSKRPENKVFLDALPILGIDGTLAESVSKDSPARGKIRAKTGTLVWTDLLNNRSMLRSKALAGVLETAKGDSLYFAMFVNNVPLEKGVSTSREGKVLGKLCEVIHANAP
jgi:D-alanyl-D-alanine carboxypeptidase/D-alanyl-D-alanine-endopeptidase (penicillin-binding protein 4)